MPRNTPPARPLHPSIQFFRDGAAFGYCERCESGSLTNEDAAIALFALDRVGYRAWVCVACFEARNDGATPHVVASMNGDHADMDYITETVRDYAVIDFGYTPGEFVLDEAMLMDDEEPPQYDDDDEEDEEMPSVARHVERYSFDTDYEPITPRLLLPELPGRMARMVSVEQEVGRGGPEICARLHAAGHTRYSYMLGYHSSGRNDNLGFCHVEEDSSVNAEIIYGKMTLSDPDTARTFEDALMVVRGAIQDDAAKLDMRCGLHVHVDVRGYGMAEIESLYHLWNSLEDTIFRLAAANWRCHRTSLADYNYAPPTNKGYTRRADLGRHFEGARGALNMSNYLGARGNCRCGAFQFADWQDCTCNLGKSTVEFRVFNATANLRKIHAYTALSLAMVEAARNVTFDSSLDPFAFRLDREEVTAEMVEPTKHALGVIFEALPLTETEREDLAYCARNSSVKDAYEEVYG